jgi:hypothetical protein
MTYFVKHTRGRQSIDRLNHARLLMAPPLAKSKEQPIHSRCRGLIAIGGDEILDSQNLHVAVPRISKRSSDSARLVAPPFPLTTWKKIAKQRQRRSQTAARHSHLVNRLDVFGATNALDPGAHHLLPLIDFLPRKTPRRRILRLLSH